MNIVVTVSFVIAVTVFFTDKLGLKRWKAFLMAALVCLVAAEYPVFIANFPQFSQWLDPIAKLRGIII